MRCRLRAVLCLSMLLSLPAAAAETAPSGPASSDAAPSDSALPDPAAHEIVTGRFTQKRHLPALERALVSSGRFAWTRDRGLLWQVRDPVASTLVIDDTGVLQDGEPVTGADALRALAPIFGAVFAGDPAALERHFTTVHEPAASGWRLRLTPRDAAVAAAIEHIVVAGDAEPASLVLLAADGGRTELVFRDVARPDRLDDELHRAFGRGR